MVIVDRVRSLLPTGGFGRGVATVAFGTGLAQIIVIASSPILTRLYDPSAYGTFAVALSVIAVLITMTCLRYEFAIPLPEDELTAANLVALAVLANLVLSISAAVVLAVAGSAVFGALGAPTLAPWAVFIAFSQFAGGLAAAFTNLAVRVKAYPDIARSRFTQSIALVSVQILLGLASAGALGMLVGDAAGRISGALQLTRSTWRRHALAFRAVSIAGIRAAAQRYRRFPIYSSGSAVLATVGVQAPLLFLVALYGSEAGGIYALAARVCAIPLALVANAVGQVFVAESAALARTDPPAVRTIFVRTTRSLARMAIVPALVAMVGAPLLAGPVFGSDWAQAGLFVAVLVPSYYMEFVIGATGDVLFVVERQDLHLMREILRFTLVGLAIPVAAWLGLPTIGAVIALSLAGVLNYTLYGLISWRAVRSFHARAMAAVATEATTPHTGADPLDPTIPS